MSRALARMGRFVVVSAACFVAACNLAPRSDATLDAATTLVLSGATIYPSPTDEPLLDGVVVIRTGKIFAVGKRDSIAIPAGATMIDCRGQYLVAGFQNSHVHFTEPKWDGARSLPAAQLSHQLQDFALRWGFTTVVDIGSDLGNTLALRVRIERGEIIGPRILTAGVPFYPVDGIPFYLKDSLPPEILTATRARTTPGCARPRGKCRTRTGRGTSACRTEGWNSAGRRPRSSSRCRWKRSRRSSFPERRGMGVEAGAWAPAAAHACRLSGSGSDSIPVPFCD